MTRTDLAHAHGKHLIIVMLLASLAACGQGRCELQIVNNSQETIETVNIHVCDLQFDLGNLAPGGSTKIRFSVTRDCGYKVTVHFQSGRALQKEDGYVTTGMDISDSITVTQNDILFDAGSKL